MTGPLMIDIEGIELSDQDRSLLEHPLTGGVILFARNFVDRQQVRSLIKQIHAIKSPSLVVAVDQEGGRVQRFKNQFTALPSMRLLGELYEQDVLGALQLSEDIGWLMGVELRDVGVDLNFAPVIDVDYGCSQVIGDRAFSQKPKVVIDLAKSLVGGLHSAGVSACAKHFPGHGAVSEDSHFERPTDDRTKDQVMVDLEPFEQVLSYGVESVMTAHLVVSCEDRELVSFSEHWIQQILRRRLNFRGIVFSDDLSMKGADVEGGISAKVTKALAAGCDFLPICNDRESVETLYASPTEITQTASFDTLRANSIFDESVYNTTRYQSTVERISQLMEAQ